jgi:dehydrogenase/reductase SDR family member 1
MLEQGSERGCYQTQFVYAGSGLRAQIQLPKVACQLDPPSQSGRLTAGEMMMTPLREQVALVTGASRGVGRGVALGLAAAGARVFGTGRSIAHADLGPAITRITCDHTDDLAVAEVFREIAVTTGRLDILVNVAWGGYERMVEAGQFTFSAPFWEQPTWRWEAMVTAGVRAAFVASQHAARLMVPARRGLIVHLSSWAAQKYLANSLYGLSKAATDKMTADMAHELQPHGVTVVSLYPGLVRTEAVLAAGVFDLSTCESPEFIGRAVAALAGDPDVLRRSGSVLVAAALADEYGFTDIDGRQPRALTLADV